MPNKTQLICILIKVDYICVIGPIQNTLYMDILLSVKTPVIFVLLLFDRTK